MAEWKWGNPLSNGFRNEPQEGYAEVTPDAGRPYRRQQFSDISDILSFQVTLTKMDYTSFMSWYNRDIAQGSIPFDFYDCRIEETRTARIVGKPTYSTNSIYYNVNIVLNLDPIIRTVYKALITEDGIKYITTEDDKVILVPVKEQL